MNSYTTKIYEQPGITILTTAQILLFGPKERLAQSETKRNYKRKS